MAVPDSGAAVQQWMCDAVVVPSKPENDMSMDRRLAAVSITTVAKPVPGEAFAGDSFGPDRNTWYVIGVAWAAVAHNISNASRRDLFISVPSDADLYLVGFERRRRIQVAASPVPKRHSDAGSGTAADWSAATVNVQV